jgi:hypothetical protein
MKARRIQLRVSEDPLSYKHKLIFKILRIWLAARDYQKGNKVALLLYISNHKTLGAKVDLIILM